MCIPSMNKIKLTVTYMKKTLMNMFVVIKLQNLERRSIFTPIDQSSTNYQNLANVFLLSYV